MALAFAREGADVAIAYLDEHEDAKETERWVKDAGRRAMLLPGDVARRSARERAEDGGKFGRLDVWSTTPRTRTRPWTSSRTSAPSGSANLRTNVGGMFFLSRAALPHLPAGAVIINTTSINAYQPKPNILDYATTKGAIGNFTGAGAGARPEGIRVNAVAPGPVWTPLIQQSFSPDKVRNSRLVLAQESRSDGGGCPDLRLSSAKTAVASTAGILGVTGGKPLA